MNREGGSGEFISDLMQLLEIGRVITSTLDLEHLLTLVMDMTMGWFAAEVGYIHLTSGKVVNWGMKEEDLKQIKLSETGENVLDYVLLQKESLLIEDLQKAERFEAPEEVYSRLRTLMVGLLEAKGTVLGVLVLANKIGWANFLPSDFRLFRILLQHVSVAVMNAKIYTELLELKNYNDYILSSVGDGILTFDNDGVIKTANRAASEITGYEEYELRGKSAWSIFKDSENVKNMTQNCLKTGLNYKRFETQLESKDGNIKIVRLQISRLTGAEGPIGGLYLMEDITGIRELEKQMQRAEKLAALGELAAGIAHEIKNPLAAIYGYAQLLETRRDDPQFLEEFKDVIMNEVTRLNEIVNALLSFARPQIKEKKPSDLAEIVKKSLFLLGPEAEKKNVKLHFEEPPEPVWVLADANAIEQVIINIVLNAVQAIGSDGNVWLSVDKAGSFALLTVKDDGPGIPQENLDRLFDPFFTTKANGTGLGLSISHRIIEEHNGRIVVESSPGQGATFKIYLPLVEAGGNAEA